MTRHQKPQNNVVRLPTPLNVEADELTEQCNDAEQLLLELEGFEDWDASRLAITLAVASGLAIGRLLEPHTSAANRVLLTTVAARRLDFAAGLSNKGQPS